MIKTILVDDDVEMLEGLSSIIDWEAYGLAVIGTYKNGFEALNAVSRYKPEIIISDITMPNMDGFELIREAKKFNSGISSIILSCHEEFEYAQEAIRLNADEYLIKHTLTSEALAKTILRLREKVLQRREERSISQRSTTLKKLDELCSFFSLKLCKAALESNVEALLGTMAELIECDLAQFSLGDLRDAMRRLLIDTALNIQNTDISVEIVQLNSSNFEELVQSFEASIRHMAGKLALSAKTRHPEILKVLTYISEHLDENLSCEKLAAQVNMNSNYFSRLFKREIGMNFSDFLMDRKVQRATELLRNSDCPIDDIVASVGIESISYFYRIYKRYTGKTPGDIRNRSKTRSPHEPL